MPATETPRAQNAPKPVRSGGSFADEAKILKQTYFKSVGPRTYAAQLKIASTGNHFLLLTEGRRDAKTGEVRKTKLLVWSEDFIAFFNMLRESAQFIKAHPVPDDVRGRQERKWSKKNKQQSAAPKPSASARDGPARGVKPAR